eukprot:3280500-Pyramimonas_sp.AAC.1
MAAAIAAMRPSDARRLCDRIQNGSRYAEKPYDLMSDFAQDLAAVCATHPNVTQRKTSKPATVLSSLEHVATAQELGYTQNFCKHVTNSANYEVIFGTTRNEAFHKQLQAFYRNV